MANIALCVISVLFAFIIAEGLGRAAGYGRVLKRLSFQYPQFYHRPDPVNGYDIAPDFPATDFQLPDFVRTFGTGYPLDSNEVGCRDRSMEKADGYVLLLGDSFTWANVPLQHAYGSIMESITGGRVLKCGVSGYGTRHELHKLKKVVNLVGRPKAIIVGYYIGNDLIDDYLYPEYSVMDGYLLQKIELKSDRTQHDPREIVTEEILRHKLKEHLRMRSAMSGQGTTMGVGIKTFLYDHSLVYNVLRDTGLRRVAASLGLAGPAPRPFIRKTDAVFHSVDEYPWLEHAWQGHLANLRQLKRSADELNATLIVVLIPTSDQVYEFLRPTESTYDWQYPNERLSQFLFQEGIPFLDLLPEFRRHVANRRQSELDPRQDLYWPGDRHWNLKGNHLAGMLIAHFLLEQGLLDVPDRGARLSRVKSELGHIHP
ncbi:hypothetical protein YTPLAS18_18390 [Nitrospira sp.]|nr:hypothetical protein YTPLAS18_18390 [Nitrospira sp.]